MTLLEGTQMINDFVSSILCCQTLSKQMLNSNVYLVYFTGTERYFECRDNEIIQVSEQVL